MKIPEFADKMENILEIYRDGSISDEEFYRSASDLTGEMIDSYFKKQVMENPNISQDVKNLVFPPEL